MGGVLAWPQWLLCCLLIGITAIAAPLFLLGPVVRRWRFLVTLAIPLIVWAIASLQTREYPTAIVNVFAGGVAAADANWIPQAIRAEANTSGQAELQRLAQSSLPATIDAGLTRQFMVLVALFFATLLVASAVIRDRHSILAMLLIGTLAGAVFSFLGISDAVRPQTPGLEQADFLTPENAGAPFGSFVNRNNAAGYLNLCLAMAAGLLVYSVLKQRANSAIDARYEVPPEHWWQRPIFAVQDVLRNIDARSMAILLIMCLIVAGIAISGSRGGLLGAIAGTISASLLTREKGAGMVKSLVITVLAIGTLFILGTVGLIEQVSERLETIWASNHETDGRLTHWGDGLRAAWYYFPFGSGLGTYRYAYLPFQTSSAGAWFVNADGMHVEMLVEGGLWFVLLVLTMLALSVADLTSLVHLKRAPHVSALITTGWFALGATLVSQSFDFGITLPAMFMTLALILGSVAGTSDRFAEQLAPKKRRKRLDDVINQLAAEKSSAVKSNAEKGGAVKSGPTETRAAKIAEASNVEEPASSIRPRSGSLRTSVIASNKPASNKPASNSSNPVPKSLIKGTRLFASFAWAVLWAASLGILWLSINQTYQLASEANGLDDPTAPPAIADLTTTDGHLDVTESLVDWQSSLVPIPRDLPEGVTADMLQRLASVSGRRAAYYLTAKPAGETAQSVLQGEQSLQALRQARQHALAALLKSPLSPEARYRLIQLDFIAPLQAESAEPAESAESAESAEVAETDQAAEVTEVLIEQMAQLRSRNATVLIALARQALVHPGPQSAGRILKSALTLSPQTARTAWPILFATNDLQQAIDGLPDDAEVIATILESNAKLEAEWRQSLLQRAEEILQQQPERTRTAEQHMVAGRIAVQSGDWSQAAASFNLAVEDDPSTTEYRFQLVKALLALGQQEQALKQLERCRLQDPTNKIYQQKQRELSKR